MARPKRGTVGSKYVAIGALTELLDKHTDLEMSGCELIARQVVEGAWDVEHFPVAGKVQITLDLAALDRPIPYVPVDPQAD